jgi:transposase-like protein
MAKMGRPSKYSMALAERICGHIREGVSLHGASEICGVNPSTFHDWRHKHSDFAKMVIEANGASEAALVGYAMNTARTDGRVAVQMLERRFQDRWQRHEHHQVTANHTLNTVTPQVIEGLASLPESPRIAQNQHTSDGNTTKTAIVNV